MPRMPCLLVLPIILLLVACSAETEPATNVTDNSVDFHAKVSWEPGESGQYWFKWWPKPNPGQEPNPVFFQTTPRSFGPMPNAASGVPITERLRPNCVEVPAPCTPTSGVLNPNASYLYQICGRLTGGQSACFGREPTVNSQPEVFVTQETDSDEHTIIPACPLPETGPDGYFVCEEPVPPSSGTQTALAPEYYKEWHKRYVLAERHLGHVIIYSVIHWKRSAGAFNGRQGRFNQTVSVVEERDVRVGFRVKVFHGTGHGDLADQVYHRVPDSTEEFTRSAEMMPWYRYHDRDKYHAHLGIGVRVEDRPSALWKLATNTPYYYCGSGQCQWP